MGAPMRFRTDSLLGAEFHARELAGKPAGPCSCAQADCIYLPENYRTFPPAEPGDTWRLRWGGTKDEQGPICGYAIFCPGCRQIHHWTTANNCASKRALAGGGTTCDHTGKSSCWTWSGSAEDGTLTANPSLHSDASKGGCGWHGWLRNGELVN